MSLIRHSGQRPESPYSAFSPTPIRIIHTQCTCGTLVRVDVNAKKPPQPAVCPSCLSFRAQGEESASRLIPQESALYPLEVNLDGATKHSVLCTGAFGRYDLHCRRCLELRDGAARRGWSHRKEPLGQQRLAL